ncbi:MAG: c-type cytochrome, partial [Gemmataceae bacterium]|nr:c-type cytochrome [Gemmataceae bacterium]
AADVQRAGKALLGLSAKSLRDGHAQDRHWPLRVAEVAEALHKTSPELAKWMLDAPDFGLPEHLLFVGPLKLDRAEAARKFVAKAKGDPKYQWTGGAVELLGALPRKDTDALLLDLWKQGGLEDAVLRVLALDPQPADRAKLAVGLKSLDAGLVRACAEALAKFPPADAKEVALQGVRALKRFPDPKTDAATRAAVVAMLERVTGAKPGADEKAWAAWLVKTYPESAKSLDATDGFDAEGWKKRLAGIDWARGDSEKGRAAFTKASCAACHDGGRAVGPSLLGVAKRFSRDDLLTATLQPSKDVPPRYRPTRITTTDDKSYTGIIVYEATDGVILQTGADTTVRIAGADVATKKQVEVSLMPAGLLDKLTDAEIADLLAYLGALK